MRLSNNHPGYGTLYNTNSVNTPEPITSEKPSGETLQVFPNPTQGELTIINPSLKENSEVRIYDVSGKTIYRNEILNGRACQLEISALENGVYFMLIDNQRFKLVINK